METVQANDDARDVAEQHAVTESHVEAEKRQEYFLPRKPADQPAQQHPKARAKPQRRDRNPCRTTEMLRTIARLFFQGEIPMPLLAQTIMERMGVPEQRAKLYASAIAEQQV